MAYPWQHYPQQGQAHPQTSQNMTSQAQQPVTSWSGLGQSNQSAQSSAPQQAGQQAYGGYPQQGNQGYSGQALQNPYQQQPYPTYGSWGTQSGAYATSQPVYLAQGTYNYQGYGQYPQQQWGYQQAQHPYVAPGPQGYLQQPPYAQGYAQLPQQQKVAKPSLNTCYNCGDPSHWAQDCPEPHRAVPHGQLAQQQNKSHKPNYIPPVVTKYPPPPQAKPNSAGPYGPSSGSSYGLSTPVGHLSSNPSSAQAVSMEHQQSWQALQNPPSASPLASTPFNPNESPNSGAQSQHMASKSPSITGTASYDHPAIVDNTTEGGTDQDDLALLDIPDFPKNHGAIIAKPPSLVRHPLPALSESDVLGEMLPPTLMSDGKIQSKYITGSQEEYINQGTEDIDSCEERRHDPLFSKNLPLKPLIPPVIPQAELSSAQSSARSNVVNLIESPSAPITSRKRKASVKADGVEGPAGGKASAEVMVHAIPQKPLPLATTHNNHRIPPPPPPPPRRQSSWPYSGHGQSPVHESPSRRSRRYSSHALDSISFEDAASPTDEAHSQKKRKLSDSEGRQYDDVTPKLKRNQPKVAEVYSRRW